MNKLFLILTTAIMFGFAVFLTGILIPIYTSRFRLRKSRGSLSLTTICNMKPFRYLLSFITKNKNSAFYRFNKKLIKISDANISIEELIVLKFMVLVLAVIVVTAVSYTNTEVVKASIISRSGESISIMDKAAVQDYADNISFYNAVMRKIGKGKLNELENDKRIDAVRSILPDIIKSDAKEDIDEKTQVFIRTYNAVESVRIINWKVLAIIIVSFWMPDAVLIIRRLLLGNRYRNELLKLENIFELLGSIRGFKTIHIIEEMARSSKLLNKQLENCRDAFKTNRELALDALKASVSNARMSKLVDVMRIYSITDKQLAVQILERSRMEREEAIFLTAEEDIDTADVVAFISICPILLELANLLMKPMLDMIYEAFRYV